MVGRSYVNKTVEGPLGRTPVKGPGVIRHSGRCHLDGNMAGEYNCVGSVDIDVADLNVEQQFALAIFEFLRETEARFALHPVVNFGWASLADNKGFSDQNTAWLSCMRPNRYVEIYVRPWRDGGAEAEIQHMRASRDGRGDGRSAAIYDYGIGAAVCRCDECREKYQNPMASTSVLELDRVDLSDPGSFDEIRFRVLEMKWP